jgi:Tfp pilus assembly protein PilP
MIFSLGSLYSANAQSNLKRNQAPDSKSKTNSNKRQNTRSEKKLNSKPNSKPNSRSRSNSADLEDDLNDSELGVLSEEQELFEQLESLNFKEVGFYRAYRSFIYSPSGRTSPFKIPEALSDTDGFNQRTAEKAVGLVGLKAYDLRALKLTSLIWKADNPRALIVDPTGQSHRVEVGTELGKNQGYVAKIREGELVVIEKQKVSGDDGKKQELFRTQVLKIAR